jgi:hypothetical protein
MSKKVYILANPVARQNAIEAVKSAQDGFKVTVAEPTRSLDQNAAQWPILDAFSEQLAWSINGVMTKLEPEDWKTILTAAFRQEGNRVAQGLDGGLVFLGMRTSKMSKKEFSDYLEFLNATAVLRGVNL